MDESTRTDITQILTAWRGGDPEALDRLTPLVYEELRIVAQAYLAAERRGHILQPSALVNEAFLALLQWQPEQQWQDRVHFFSVCAKMMRRILVKTAREHQALKRGGGALRVSLSEASGVPDQPQQSAELVALNGALDVLEQLSPRQARTIELRFFAGLSLEDTAEAMGSSVSTVRRDFRMARAWLYQQLRETS
jgi:RNA polymerase sigma factor (TIGR02999 family)